MAEEEYKWYIVNVSPGYEKKVTQSIEEQAKKKSILESFEQINMPVEQVTKIRRGQKINAEKKILPGYILVKMQLNDETWHIINSIREVKGFLGNGGKPRSVPENQVKLMIEESLSVNKHSVSFQIGESVRIIEGPFESFMGIVEEIDEDKSRLKISVSILGRSTPVELEYTQVTKV